MSRFFRTSSTPLVDYSYQAPIDIMAAGLQARQNSYDTNKAEWEENIQVIEDTPYLKLGLGDEEAHKELMDKYKKLADEAATTGDYSQMGRQLDYIKREVAKDFGINGSASNLTARNAEYAAWLKEYKTKVANGTLREGDSERFMSQFNKFSDNGELNSLGVPSVIDRPDYQKKITDYMTAVIKDDKDVKMSQDESGRYFIKTKYGGVKEAELNKQLNAFIETLPGHQEWRRWDERDTLKGLSNEDGTINTNSDAYYQAENLVAESMLETKSKIEKIDELLKDKKLSKSYRQQLLDEKAAAQEDYDATGKYGEKEIQNIALNQTYSAYNKKITDPYMGRANWGVEDISMKADEYDLADYKHRLRLSEIDYENKQSLSNIVMLPGEIVPFDQETTKENFDKIKANNAQVNKDFNSATMTVFSDLAKVDPKLQATLDAYNNASGGERKNLEAQINKKVRDWYSDYSKNPEATGTYKSILEKHMPDYKVVEKTWKDSQIVYDKAENSAKLNAQVIMTEDLETSINDLKTYLTAAGNPIPPELQDAFSSDDPADFVAAVLANGKLEKHLKGGKKDSLGRALNSTGTGSGMSSFDQKAYAILDNYKKAMKPVERGESFMSQNTYDINWTGDAKDKVTTINEGFTDAIERLKGYSGSMSMNGNTVSANEAKAIAGGKVKSRTAMLSSTVNNGTPYMKVITEYEKDGETKVFSDYMEIPPTEMRKYINTFAGIAADPGAQGNVGRIALGRYDVGDTFSEGDFLYNSKNGQETIMGTYNEYKIVPYITDDNKLAYELHYSQDMTEPDPEKRIYAPVNNYHNSDPNDHSIGDINTVFEIIGKNKYAQ